MNVRGSVQQVLDGRLLFVTDRVPSGPAQGRAGAWTTALRFGIRLVWTRRLRGLRRPCGLWRLLRLGGAGERVGVFVRPRKRSDRDVAGVSLRGSRRRKTASQDRRS